MDSIDLQPATVWIGDQKLEEKNMARAPSVKAGHILSDFGLTPEEFGQLTTSERLRVQSGSLGLDVPLRRLGDVRELLRQCQADLLETWGLPKSVQAQLQFTPVGNDVSGLVRASDYPESAMQRHAVGRVEARATIGTDGVPRDCVVVRSSGHKDLDETTCRVFVERARFQPARLKNDPYAINIRWVM